MRCYFFRYLRANESISWSVCYLYVSQGSEIKVQIKRLFVISKQNNYCNFKNNLAPLWWVEVDLLQKRSFTKTGFQDYLSMLYCLESILEELSPSLNSGNFRFRYPCNSLRWYEFDILKPGIMLDLRPSKWFY